MHSPISTEIALKELFTFECSNFSMITKFLYIFSTLRPLLIKNNIKTSLFFILKTFVQVNKVNKKLRCGELNALIVH